ncbi:MAG: DUF2156 domain-containing protein [Candidatus Omnitrophica bacterium]|nr:DUF2156 domain-containing protein [Candidatus Omnitrophota bacterium]
MHIEDISLEHRALLDKRLKHIGAGLSDFSFSGMYLFRRLYNNELIFDNDNIFIRGKTHDGFTHLMLTCHPKDIEPQYLKSMLRYADFLFPIPEPWLAEVFLNEQFQCVFNDGDSDYVYDISRISAYSGRKLHNKRNLLKQFISGYEHKSYPLIEEYKDAARKILDEWQENSGEDKNSTDYYPCLEALQKSEELILCGMIYYVGNEPAGFILGEELTADIFDIKFAKAKKKFKGIYQYLYNDLAKLLPKKYAFFNFEEDLGKQELRSAKSSYIPSRKLLKYRVSLR